MATQGTDFLVVVDDMPAITKLQNGRHRLEFFCQPSNKKEGWYGDDISKWLPDFGTLSEADFTGEGWEPELGRTFPDQRLIEASAPYVPSANEHYVKLTYETLTSTLTQVQDDTISCTSNGLKQVERVTIAVAGTAYSNVVGSSSIVSDGTTLYLARKVIEQNDAFMQVTETWIEAGILSRSKDSVGSQLAVSFEMFNQTPTASDANSYGGGSSYTLASENESEVDGIPTRRYTFLEAGVLSRSKDNVGSQLAVSFEMFNQIPTVSDANSYGGGSSYVLADESESEVEGIPTKRYTFLEDGAVLSTSEKNLSEGVKEVTTVFFNTEGATTGPVIAQSTRDVDGLPTISVTTLQDKDGNSIVQGGENLVHSYEQLTQFTYPGVVEIGQTTLTGTGSLFNFESKDFVLDPPVESLVKATTYVFFQTANTITSADYTYNNSAGLWNPTEWASGSATGIGWNYTPFSKELAFRGYRSIPSSFSGIEDGDPWALIAGTRMFQETSWAISVSGGPQDPAGKRFVLDVKISTAFDDVADTTYYKKVIVVADIPAKGADVLT